MAQEEKDLLLKDLCITMATTKKYIKPSITTIFINGTNILCSSGPSTYICSNLCKLWHMCQDRSLGKYCPDKK